MPSVGRGYLDLERGVFHRRAQGARETKKRQPLHFSARMVSQPGLATPLPGSRDLDRSR
jgi:hypothetical protein